MLTRKSYSFLASLGLAAQVADAQYAVLSAAPSLSGGASSAHNYAAAGGFNLPVTSASTLETSVIPSSKEAVSSILSYQASPPLSESLLVSSARTSEVVSSGYPTKEAAGYPTGSSIPSSLETSIIHSSSYEPPTSAYPASKNLTDSPTSSGGILSSLSSYVLGGSPPTKIASAEGNNSSTLKVSAEPTASYGTSSINDNSTVHTSASAAISSSLNASAHTGSVNISEMTTSTVYSTNIYTITSCAPEIKDCPGKLGAVTTELVSIGTTICPVTALQSKSPASTASLSPQASSSLPAASSIIPSASKSVNSSISSIASSLSSAVGSALPSLSSMAIASVTPSAAPQQMPTTYSVSSEITTTTLSTVFSTAIYTVTSCAPEVTDCPARKGKITTEFVSLYTTICPVTHKVLDGVTYTPSPPSPLTPVNAVQTPPTPTPLTSTGISTSVVSPNVTQASSIASSLASSSYRPLNVTTSSTDSSSSHPATLANYTTAAPTNSSAPPATPATPVELTTSTIYSTNTYIITSCAPEVKNCPGRGQVTTELIAISTTVCPVSGKTTATPEVNAASTASPVKSESTPVSTSAILTNTSLASSELTTYTVFSTNSYTVTSCAPEVTDCPARLGAVTTEVIAVSTTVCPVTEAAKGGTSPVLAAPAYSTADVTLSHTVGSSTMLIVTTIAYQDTPAPSSIKATAAESSQEPSQPGTTVALGSHYTTVIEYGTLTSNAAATTAAAPTLEAPKYPTGPASAAPVSAVSTYQYSTGGGTSGTGAIANQSASPSVGVSSSPRLAPPLPFVCLRLLYSAVLRAAARGLRPRY